jgi:NADPH:quinone reductase-like Zn-dependent oxidoreductase
MLAAVCHSYGPPEAVTIEEVPRPAPAAGEVEVEIAAASVNFPDVLVVAGEYQIKVPPPFVAGSEFVGRVSAIGEGAGAFAVGDRVAATAISGAFAQFATVPLRSLQPVPSSVDDATAAAFGVAYRTAFHSLKSVAKVQPGEEVLVLGASGGVGLAAVELATLMGATVTAVASSPERLAVAASRGAVRVVDRTTLDLRGVLKTALPRGADVVIDPVGGTVAEPALRSVAWGGRYVTIGFASGHVPRLPLNLVLLKSAHVMGFEFRGFVEHFPREAERNDAELFDLLASGRIRPHIGATYSLADAAKALRYVADGNAIGKVVIEIGVA